MINIKKILSRKIIFFLIGASIVFAMLTYLALKQADSDLTQNSYVLILLFFIDSILFFSFVIFLSRKLFSIWIKRKQKSQGSRLQSRILVMFGLLSIIPAILIAIFSTFFFRHVIDSWFDKKLNIVLDESIVVAGSYLKEHQEVIKIRAKAMAMEIDNNIIQYDLVSNERIFVDIVSSLTDLNALSEAVIFHNHTPIIRSRFGASLSFTNFSEEDYRKAASGEIVVIKDYPDKVRAMAALRSIPNSFLVVGKYIDSKVVNHIKKSQGAAEQYRNLKNKIVNTQLQFTVIFLLVSMLVLLTSMYIGISFAGTISNPIINLVNATKKVQAGNFSTKLEEGPENDELANLSRAFNLMTERIAAQQDKLIQANNEIDDKRKFNEAVLSGVSTGIIALSTDRKIELINESGAKLLNVGKKSIVGYTIDKVILECAELIDNIAENYQKHKKIHSEISIKTGRKFLTLFVQIVAEVRNKKIIGYIITFDDMTELVQAQRYAAWSDVARRIAHEVKNPLTPIRLGAERLDSKYAKEVKDSVTFQKYTKTIIRHVNDIGKIIEEFSRFARMPAPVMDEVDIAQVVNDLVFSRQCVVTRIKYLVNTEDNLKVLCDQTQINQMLINVLKNSEESIEATERFNNNEGKIEVSVSRNNKNANILIKDNGKGFKVASLDKITEPYFTTRASGTGLGLAIVKKIIDDHNGKLIIKNDKNNCAVINIMLPLILTD
jgi:two-component system, NtrC family, nitrogen regulation sensor histidine kinase NtrY